MLSTFYENLGVGAFLARFFFVQNCNKMYLFLLLSDAELYSWGENLAGSSGLTSPQQLAASAFDLRMRKNVRILSLDLFMISFYRI